MHRWASSCILQAEIELHIELEGKAGPEGGRSVDRAKRHEHANQGHQSMMDLGHCSGTLHRREEQEWLLSLTEPLDRLGLSWSSMASLCRRGPCRSVGIEREDSA
jgi:hypothetical protein